MHIRDIDNPEQFQRFIKDLFAAEYGSDFQAIDDSGGDSGNDGFIMSQATLCAVFCPEKKADAKRYIAKAESDFALALKLREDKKYSLRRWLFITPSDLTERVQTEIRLMGAKAGISAECFGETHVRGLFDKHPQLGKRYPELAAPDIVAHLLDIKEVLKGTAQVRGSQAPPPASPFTLSESPKLSAAQAAMLRGDEQQARELLQLLRRESRNERERAWADSLLVQCLQHNAPLDEIEAIAREGISLSEKTGEVQPLVVCKAELGSVLCRRYFEVASKLYASVRMARGIGLLGVSIEELKRLQTTAEAIHSEAQDAFREASDKAKRVLKSPRAYLRVLTSLSGGLLSVYLADSLSETDLHQTKVRLRELHEETLSIATKLEDPGLIAIGHLNFAVCLRSLDDLQGALIQVERAIHFAQKARSSSDLAKAKGLLERINEELWKRSDEMGKTEGRQ